MKRFRACARWRSEGWYYDYLTGMIGVSLLVSLLMCDTKADSAMHRHE